MWLGVLFAHKKIEDFKSGISFVIVCWSIIFEVTRLDAVNQVDTTLPDALVACFRWLSSFIILKDLKWLRKKRK